MPFTTREEVYKTPKPHFLMPPRIDEDVIERIKLGYKNSPWTPEFAAELLRETKFTRTRKVREWTDEFIAMFAKGDKTCQYCMGTEKMWVPCKGEITGIECAIGTTCVCKYPIAFYRMWNDPKMAPERFRDANLDTVAPSSKSSLTNTEQESIIAKLKEHRTGSWFLLGAPGTGKTYLMTALLRDACHRYIQKKAETGYPCKAVFRIEVSNLLREHRNYELRPDKGTELDTMPAPTVSVEKIAEAVHHGYRVSLFLDELDKIKGSEYEMNALFAIIDAVYANKGQLVATSNKTSDELIQKWGEDVALALIRRIGQEQEEARTIDFNHPVEADAKPPAPEKTEGMNLPPQSATGEKTTEPVAVSAGNKLGLTMTAISDEEKTRPSSSGSSPSSHDPAPSQTVALGRVPLSDSLTVKNIPERWRS